VKSAKDAGQELGLRWFDVVFRCSDLKIVSRISPETDRASRIGGAVVIAAVALILSIRSTLASVRSTVAAERAAKATEDQATFTLARRNAPA
jgi:hypothetical protein